MREPSPGLLTAPSPRTIWIELSSKCPFDCVFCSRSLARGAGEHMDFKLYESLIRQLDHPGLIRLNYSGESIHYPRLEDAIRLAKSTGAMVELVTALASAAPSVVRGLVASKLDRLSVSLHSLDADQYSEIYGFSSLRDLRARIAELLEIKRELGSETPVLDFAFVAMDRNLDQLPRLAAYAGELEVSGISIHPVIRRDRGLIAFPVELDEQDFLRPSFAQRLEAGVNRTQEQFPHVRLTIARPLEPGASHPGGVATCEQNPWETLHVLANGDAVVCEVQDRTVMGSAATASLQSIWHGSAYAAFRRAYLDGVAPACRTCPWKGASRFVRGWYESEPGGVTWSSGAALLALPNLSGKGELFVKGLLPPGAPGAPNRLEIWVNGEPRSEAPSRGDALTPFECAVPLPSSSGTAAVEFRVDHPYCPARRGESADLRELGFALLDAKVRHGGPPSLRLAARIARILERSSGPPVRLLPDPGDPIPPGLSVLIPERGAPALLRDCLAGLRSALGAVTEAAQAIVLVNGAEPAGYRGLQREFPWVEFLFHTSPLGFGRAIQRGLRRVRHGWVYLLNSDMALDRRTLAEALDCRSPARFAIASRVIMRDGSKTESNWTDLRVREGLVEIWDAEPPSGDAVRGTLYAGGGSSLFQTRLLRLLSRQSRDYDPFYWEDVEWGVVARRHGYECVFCPASRAWHIRQATVRRFYAPAEIDRIFTRNRLLFQWRNLCELGHIEAVFEALCEADGRTRAEMMAPMRLLRAMRARRRSARSPEPENRLIGCRDVCYESAVYR